MVSHEWKLVHKPGEGKQLASFVHAVSRTGIQLLACNDSVANEPFFVLLLHLISKAYQFIADRLMMCLSHICHHGLQANLQDPDLKIRSGTMSSCVLAFHHILDVQDKIFYRANIDYALRAVCHDGKHVRVRLVTSCARHAGPGRKWAG
jgi:hypothetical protein